MQSLVHFKNIVYLAIATFLIGTSLCNGVGISISGDAITLNMDQVTPGRPAIWADALQLMVQAESPWQLTVRGEGPFTDSAGNKIPLERLSWATIPSADEPNWVQMLTTPTVISSGEGPTAPDGHIVSVGLRLDPSWDDAPGGPYTTAIKLTLNGGIDLVPSYVWPQPAIAGVDEITVTYHAGGLPEDPAFPVRLHVLHLDGEIVALVDGVATPGNWCTIHWNGLIAEKASALPGAYSYTVTAEDGQLLAQGQLNFIDNLQPNGTASVTGTVNTQGELVSGAQVQLFDTAYRLIASHTTAANGSFRFTDLAVGTYFLEVRYPGYLPYRGSVTLTSPRQDYKVDIELTPNNALFITASLHLLSADPEDSTQEIRPGDVVEVRGKFRNTGTRAVLAPELLFTWPESLQPTPASNALDVSDSHTRVFKHLQPGESQEFSAVAIVGLDVKNRGGNRHFVQLQGTAWVDNGQGNLQRVHAPPVFLPLDIQQLDNGTGGLLALRFYWDTNANDATIAGEQPASGLKVNLSTGGQATSGADGWIRVPVPSGPVSVWLPHPTDPAGMQVVYTANIRPGEIVQTAVGLLPGQLQPVSSGDQALLAYTNTGSGLHGAGDVAWQTGDYTLRLNPPHRWSATFLPANTTRTQHWMLDTSQSNPTLGWRASFIETTDSTKSTTPTKPAELELSVATGGRLITRAVRLATNGSGPYILPGPALAVTHVSLQQGRQMREIATEDYSWSPAGEVWLSRPPEAMWPDAFTSIDHSVTLLVTYVPGTADITPELWPHLAATLVARPQRSQEQGLDLREELRLTYQQPWQQPGSLLRLRWERQKPGNSFTWEAGTIADTGSDPAAVLMQPPIGTSGNQSNSQPKTDESSPYFAPYIRVEQRLNQGPVQLLANHERVGAQAGQLLSVSKELNGPVQGRAGIDAWHWQTVDALRASELDAVGYLQATEGDFTLRVEQRVPLLQIGAAKPTQTRKPDAVHAGSPGAQGNVQVAWQAPGASSPRVAWVLNTLTGSEQFSLDWDRRLTSQLRATAGWRVNGSKHNTQASMQWSRVESPSHKAQLRVESGSDTGMAVYTAVQTERLQAEYSVKPQNGAVMRKAEIRLSTPVQGEIYGTLYMRHMDVPTNTFSTLNTGLALTGPTRMLGPNWHGSLHMEATAQHLANLDLQVQSGIVGVSLRQELSKMAYAVGASLPWVHVKNGFSQGAPLTWVAFERRLIEWQGSGVWVGVELHNKAGQIEPRFQIRLR